MLTKTASAHLPTKFGMFTINVFKTADETEHIALVKGTLEKVPLVRVHSSCMTGDIFSSLKCECGEQLEESMRRIQKEGNGIIVYLNQEGRGIGLTNKIRAYALQEKGYDTVEANLALGLPVDARDYKVAAQILFNLGITTIRLLTNNPIKKQQLEKYGITVTKQVPLEIKPNSINRAYLEVKKKKLSHSLSYV